ncbi:MAG: zinc-ribbon domain-containing protein [Candidatus Andersenbacteria bacterium]|nr:zinc-ribbon domain-containing protein [Candidatus Andersenbacteria bacterium]
MFCKKCGNKISTTDKFCGGCGAETYNEKELEAVKLDINNEVARGVPLDKYIDDHQGGIEYFSVSTRKLVFMSIVTFGFYPIYWFYKNWIAVKNQGGENIAPLWRSWFAIFYSDSIFNRIFISAHKLGYKKEDSFFLAIVYAIFILLARLDEPFNLLFLLSVLPLLPVQKAINFNNSKIINDYEADNKFSIWEKIIFIVGGFIFINYLLVLFF